MSGAGTNPVDMNMYIASPEGGWFSGYRPSNEVFQLMVADNWSQKNQRNGEECFAMRSEEIKATRKEFDEMRRINHIMPGVIDNLGGTLEMDEMQRMVNAKKVVDDAGGMENIIKMKKVVEEFEKKQEEEKAKMEATQTKIKAPNNAANRADTNKVYKKTLERHGLKKGAVYMIKWTGLSDFVNKEALNTAYSFGIVLGECETQQKNFNADPSKVHVRLTVYAYNEVNQLYIDWKDDAGFMTLVEKSNAADLCRQVFDDDNVGILRSADCGDLTNFSQYKEKLMNDSILAIKSHVFDSYSALVGFWNAKGRVSGKRTRHEVDYREI